MSAESGTGWVYRSNDPAAGAAAADQRPAVLRWASKVERATSNGAGKLVEKTSVPFEMLLLAVLPHSRWILWPFGGKKRDKTAA